MGRPLIAESRQVVALQRRLGAGVVVDNERPVNEVLGRPVVVDAAVPLVLAAIARGGPDKERARGIVRGGNQSEQLPDGRVGDGGALRVARHQGFDRSHLEADAALIAGEEERAVLDHRGAHAIAEDVPVERDDGPGRVEEVLRVEPLVAQKLVDRSMDGVGARLGHGIDDNPRIAAVLGAEGVLLDLELLHHVDVRLQRDLVLHHVAQVDSVQQVVGRIFARSRGVDAGDADTGGHGEESPIVGAGHHRPGREQRHIENEAAVQRDLQNLARVGHCSESGRFGLHPAHARLDIHSGRRFAQFQPHVDARPLIYVELDRALLKGPEAGMFHLDDVITGAHEPELVIAFHVGVGADRDAHIHVGQGDRNVGNRRLLRIADRSRNGGILGGQG